MYKGYCKCAEYVHVIHQSPAHLFSTGTAPLTRIIGASSRLNIRTLEMRSWYTISQSYRKNLILKRITWSTTYRVEYLIYNRDAHFRK